VGDALGLTLVEVKTISSPAIVGNFITKGPVYHLISNNVGSFAFVSL